jgi:hypothetical protein
MNIEIQKHEGLYLNEYKMKTNDILKPKSLDEIEESLKNAQTSEMTSLFKSTNDKGINQSILKEIEKRNSENEKHYIYDHKVRFLRLMLLAEQGRNEYMDIGSGNAYPAKLRDFGTLNPLNNKKIF